MRKPVHETSLNHPLKSEGGAPEPGGDGAPQEFDAAKPENTDLQLQPALLEQPSPPTKPYATLPPLVRRDQTTRRDDLANKDWWRRRGEKNRRIRT